MFKKRIIIDNSVLRLIPSFKSFNFYNQVKLLFSEVLIPQEIKLEFAKSMDHYPERQKILDTIRIAKSFYVLCTTYDPVVLDTIKTIKGIDKGEAEAAAQYKKTTVFGILSDDYVFWKAAQQAQLNLRFIDSLYVFALLDIQGFLPDRQECFKEYYAKRKFDAKKLRVAYEQAYSHLSIQHTKKQLSEKCNLQKLGLK